MKYFRDRRCAVLLVAAALLCGPAVQAAPITLWYNGDFDGRDALDNATNLASTYNGGRLYNSFVYDDFIVPAGQTWTVTSVFANIQTNIAALSTTATWQIRQGVSAGNGGTLVASGDGAAVQTATGGAVADPSLKAYALTENIPTVVLTAGTYWLTVAPDVPSPFFFDNRAYVSTTSGANAIGTPPGNDGNSFITTVGLPAAIGYNFIPTSDPSVEGPGAWDYSLGVTGTVTIASTTVPEPTTLAAWLLGLSGLSVAARRRLATWRSARAR